MRILPNKTILHGGFHYGEIGATIAAKRNSKKYGGLWVVLKEEQNELQVLSGKHHIRGEVSAEELKRWAKCLVKINPDLYY